MGWLILIGIIIFLIWLIIILIPYIAIGLLIILGVGCAGGLLVGIYYGVKNYFISINKNMDKKVYKIIMIILTSIIILTPWKNTVLKSCGVIIIKTEML